MSENNRPVSIIVPAYNVEKYIADCLDSLINQSYRNLEIIVIDDGSSDGTWKVITEYMSKDSRIKGYHTDNHGVSAARNFGLQKATGYYCSFADGDDYISDIAIETLVNVMESRNADWVNFQYNRVDEDKKPLECYNFLKGRRDLSDQEGTLSFILGDYMEYYVGYETWNKLYKMQLIKDNKLAFIEDCHLGEDLAFNIEYSYYAASLECIEDRLYFYRIRSGSAMDKYRNLQNQMREFIIISMRLRNRFMDYFEEPLRGRFYQLFFRLMNHACNGYTAKETAECAAGLEDRDFYLQYLKETVDNKSAFFDIYRADMAKVFWRYEYCILNNIEPTIRGNIYFVIYNLYRRLRKRSTMDEWKMI